MGVTLHHPHGQIYAYPVIPPVPAHMRQIAAAYHETHGRGVLQDLIAGELQEDKRLIYRGEHAVAFAILQVLALRALRYELPGVLPRGMPWLAAGASTVVGAALELYQLTVPNRSAEVMDLVWDAVGASIAATITSRLGARR